LAQVPTPSHAYELNGSYADTFGGPAMSPVGAGSIGPSGYSFAAGEGPNVNSVINPTNYSIEMYFSITDVTGFRKLIDFKDRTADAGLYDQSGAIQFFGVTAAVAPSTFVPNAMTHLVATRDGTTNQFNAYVNGVQLLSFADSSNLATFTGANQIIHLLRDDVVQNSEQSAGFLDFARIYGQPLSQAQVSTLYAAVPEPGTMILTGAVAVGAMLAARRRRTAAPAKS
jgi:hypothetical protein